MATAVVDVDATAALVERLVSEKLIDMKAATQFYAIATHKSTVVRHATRGVVLPDGSRLKLETIRVSGKLCTSKAAVLRFLTAQNTPDVASPPQLAPRSPAVRNRAAAKAGAELDALGVK